MMMMMIMVIMMLLPLMTMIRDSLIDEKCHDEKDDKAGDDCDDNDVVNSKDEQRSDFKVTFQIQVHSRGVLLTVMKIMLMVM